MAIEGVVLDVSGTLLATTSGRYPRVTDRPQPGVAKMIDDLADMNLAIIAASNDAVTAELRRSGLLGRIDYVVEQSDVRKGKGSPAWVDHFVHLTGIERHRFFYVGDSHRDMITATRGPMIFAHATWSTDPSGYGLRATSPGWVVAVARHIFQKQHPWYWTLNTTDRDGRQVRAMTLLDANGADSQQLRIAVLRLFKDNIDSRVGTSPMGLREFVMLHMLASIYDQNLFGGPGYWTTFPGHTGEPNNVMGDFLDIAAKLSQTGKYRDNLFDRHKHAMRSRDAWDKGGGELALRNQIESVRLGEALRGKVQSRSALLLDNFLTRGYTTESGRNMLLAAGASEVAVAAVGKYGQWMHVLTAPPDPWDPFSTNPPDATRFHDVNVLGEYHPEALAEFASSYAGLGSESW